MVRVKPESETILRFPDLDRVELRILRGLAKCRGLNEAPPSLHYRLEELSGVNRGVLRRHLLGPIRRKRTMPARGYVRVSRERRGHRKPWCVELDFKGEFALSLSDRDFRLGFLERCAAKWGLDPEALDAYLRLFALFFLPTEDERRRWWLLVRIPDAPQQPGFEHFVEIHLLEPVRLLGAVIGVRAFLAGGAYDPRSATPSLLPPLMFFDHWLGGLLPKRAVRAIARDLQRRRLIETTAADLKGFERWLRYAAAGRREEWRRSTAATRQGSR